MKRLAIIALLLSVAFISACSDGDLFSDQYLRDPLTGQLTNNDFEITSNGTSLKIDITAGENKTLSEKLSCPSQDIENGPFSYIYLNNLLVNKYALTASQVDCIGNYQLEIDPAAHCIYASIVDEAAFACKYEPPQLVNVPEAHTPGTTAASVNCGLLGADSYANCNQNVVSNNNATVIEHATQKPTSNVSKPSFGSVLFH